MGVSFEMTKKKEFFYFLWACTERNCAKLQKYSVPLQQFFHWQEGIDQDVGCASTGGL